MTVKRKSMLRPSIVQYSVGPEFPTERYNDVVHALADWFARSRPTVKEPVAEAKYVLECCMRGVKPSDGLSPWQNVALSSLATRIRMAAQFDIEKMEPLVKRKVGRPSRVEKEREQKQKKLAVDKNYPDEHYRPLPGDSNKADIGIPTDLVYGDNPLAFFTTKELQRRDVLKQGYLAQFPQLEAISAQAKLDLLLDLNLLMDRLRFRAIKNEKVQAVEMQMSQITERIVALEKALGIHPEQLAKNANKSEAGSIGEAVIKLDDAGGVAKLRDKWLAEEWLMLYQMYHTPSPRDDMGGYQLDEAGLYAQTRCRTCHCAACGTRNYVGFDIKEVEAELVKRGALTITPAPTVHAPHPPETPDT